MLKKLQHRFIKISLMALIVIVSIQLFAVNLINVYQKDSDVRNMLYIIAENDGIFPNSHYSNDSYINSLLRPFKKVEINIETPYSTRYFVVKLKDHYVTDINTNNIASVNDEAACTFATRIFNNDTGFGFIDNFRYYYGKDAATGKSIMVFIGFDKELESSFKLASISLLVGVICIILLIIPIWLFSKRAMKPVEKSIEKQRQFITDAGHELKTPIAIIAADADVLEICEGENEWLTSIKNQTLRLDELVKDLITLSKLEEEEKKTQSAFAHVNFSCIAQETAENFETLAKVNEISLNTEIAPNITVNGNENELKQLVSILCDNAVKYTTEKGEIKLTLKKSGKNAVMEIYNDCENIDKDKLSKLFDRFYRADSSRSRETGGYGIGLSIAQVIVQRHKGTIEARSDKANSIVFKVVI